MITNADATWSVSGVGLGTNCRLFAGRAASIVGILADVLTWESSGRIYTARVRCDVIDFTDGYDNTVGVIRATGEGTTLAAAVLDAKRNAGALAASIYPGRRIRVRHCKQY